MGKSEKYSFYENQIIIKSTNGIAKTTFEIIHTDLFNEVVKKFLEKLRNKDSPLLSIIPLNLSEDKQAKLVIHTLGELTQKNIEEINKESKETNKLLEDAYTLSLFVEQLYDFWRSYERFYICYTETIALKQDPRSTYKHFNETVEQLNYLVRKTYRDIAHNITGKILRVYRQVPAGCQVGLIVRKEETDMPKDEVYNKLSDIHFIKQVLIEPPLIINPPSNTRNGEFKKVNSNPLDNVKINPNDWLCYPAEVGDLLIHMYFHNKFMGLGTATANLFDLAARPKIQRKPDAIYMYGVDKSSLSNFDNKTIFYEDEKNDLMVAAVSAEDEFAYFGYIKKMMLTLHNIVMMKKGRIPVHGAMVRVSLKNGKDRNIVVWGDSGAGKSETLEAFRNLSAEYLRDMKIIFDDMGSLEIDGDSIRGYGTETGAFVRLDDLSPDYAFGSIDRSIIMSPQKINARAVLPITTMEEVLKGYKIDYIFYANNYEQVDNEHPILEEISSEEKAFDLFKNGPRMAKGTTTEKGLVYTYFSNTFGPSQYRELHEPIAKRMFKKFYETNLKVGVIRTRLGIHGFETKGPHQAAKALFEMIQNE